jgi:hypothetical protein
MVPPQFVPELFAIMLFWSVAVPPLEIPPTESFSQPWHEFPLTVLLFMAARRTGAIAGERFDLVVEPVCNEHSHQ